MEEDSFARISGLPIPQTATHWIITFGMQSRGRYTRVVWERFSSLGELKKRIRKVWDDSYDIATLRKAILEFRPRLQAAVTENSGPIKVHFG